MQKITYKSLTKEIIEKELKREDYKTRYLKVLKSTVLTLVVVVSFAAIIATLFMPVLQISGNSMSPTFENGEIVLALKKSNYKQGDIIAFYHGNKILIKRVIAKSGDWVDIDKDGNVYVNNKKLEEKYINNISYGNTDIKLPYQVPDNKYFVLGDDRKNSIDSRNTQIGSVDISDVVGKITLKVWPLTKFKIIN